MGQGWDRDGTGMGQGRGWDGGTGRDGELDNMELSILIFVAGGSTAKMINFIVAENLPIERVI